MLQAASPPYGKNTWDGAVIFEVSGLVFIYVNACNRQPFAQQDLSKTEYKSIIIYISHQIECYVL